MQSATAGVSPDVFWSLTLYEVTVAIRGYHERERSSIVGRIIAIGRAFAKKGDPLQGLVDEDDRPTPVGQLQGGMAAYTFWGRDFGDED